MENNILRVQQTLQIKILKLEILEIDNSISFSTWGIYKQVLTDTEKMVISEIQRLDIFGRRENPAKDSKGS